ncbi:hypothetical protein NQ317_006897 [Molorchus minor]|uniref:Protein hunchback n=1 Tax=Molorchus minor TaxID=1323400 RepID=A0ABQ9IUM7_9CUCU|nr:hypothetical protein NQ317_006897 [Molorchus minor]
MSMNFHKIEIGVLVYHATMEFVTCAGCVGVLTSYVNLITIHEATEEKINLYREIQREEDIIKLSSVLTFLGEGIRVRCQEGLELLVSKEGRKRKKDISEVQMFKCEMCEYQTRHGRSLKSHLLGHKDTAEVKCLSVTCDISEVQIFKCEMCEYQTRHKRSLKSHLLGHKDISEVNMLKCDMCEFQTKHKGNLKSHLLRHKDVSEVQMITCEICEFQTKHKGALTRHLLLHKDVSQVQMFKCETCDFKTKLKETLKSHLLGHKDISEVQMFKCEMCEFQSRHRGSLKNHLLRHKDISETRHGGSLKSHLLRHKDISEVQMFKCELCEYQTRHRRSLKSHFLGHKDVSEVQMFKCDTCVAIITLDSVLTFLDEGVGYNNVNIKDENIFDGFKNSFKRSGVQEELKLLDSSQKCKQKNLETFKCEMCEFQTKHKASLKNHFICHKDISEVQMFKCNMCEFQTRYRGSLKNHLICHKDISELQMFKCEMCEYQTRHRGSLKSHLLGHKDITEVEIFKCNMCEFQTKYKGTLKRHLLNHKDNSEVFHTIMDSVACASCVGMLTNYVNFATTCESTEEKINLYSEIRQDKDIIKLSNVLTFLGVGIQNNSVDTKKECNLDSLEYSFKGSDVKNEVELPVSSEKCERKEVEMYKCEVCEYQTKQKGTLKRHLVLHKDISEVQMFKCKMCDFQTKYKENVKRHLLGHKDISEVQMFKCEKCEFQTRHRGSLKNTFFVTRIFQKCRCLSVKCVNLRQNAKELLKATY